MGRRQSDAVGQTYALIDRLAAMTSQQIADSIKALKIRGERERSTRCPLALYARALIPAAEHVCVSPASLQVSYPRRWWYGTAALHQSLPSSARLFVLDFDRGLYPALVRDPSS